MAKAKSIARESRRSGKAAAVGRKTGRAATAAVHETRQAANSGRAAQESRRAATAGTAKESTRATAADEMVIPGEWHVRYNYSVGKVAGKFFEGLKQKKILATHCSKSGIAYLPPRAYCERAFEPCDGWIEAGHEGVIEAATIVTAQFEGLPKPPYAIAYVRLDGVSTALLNFVKGLDLTDVPAAAERLKPGTRARVVFASKPEGRITDFHYALLPEREARRRKR